jgi:hypothetical protein
MEDSKKLLTKKEVQEMIDSAIAKHNRNATLISMSIGVFLLGFYAHGVIAMVDKF